MFSSGTINRYFVIKQSAYNGLNNVELKPTCSIYPNPSNGIYYLDQCDLLVNRIVLKDLTGKELRTFQIENNKLNKIEVDLPNGVYLMTLFSDNDVYNTKIVLHR
jgi:hypothetical protein